MLVPSEKGPHDLDQLRPARIDAALISDLNAKRAEWADAGVSSIAAIGDALAPATIAHRCVQDAATRKRPMPHPLAKERCLSSASLSTCCPFALIDCLD